VICCLMTWHLRLILEESESRREGLKTWSSTWGTGNSNNGVFCQIMDTCCSGCILRVNKRYKIPRLFQWPLPRSWNRIHNGSWTVLRIPHQGSEKMHMHYIVPLRRNSALFPDRVKFDFAFIYNWRPIGSARKPSRAGYVYNFQNPVMGGEEES